MTFLSEPPATPGAEAIYAEDQQDYGFVMNLSRVWAHVPEVNRAVGDAIRAAGAPFSLRERGVMVTATASTIGDSYCAIAWGERLAGAAGADVAAGVLGGDDSGLTERERVLAVWARRVAGGPGRTNAADVEELRAAGWSDAEIASATVYVALRMAFSTVNGALGAAPDAGLAAKTPAEVLAAITWGRPVDA